MVRFDTRFVIVPGRNISLYCYSVFRVEPYNDCTHNCLYCYGRWYRYASNRLENPTIVKAFFRYAKLVRGAGARTIPFRASTLVDPLQPAERTAKLTLKILECASRFKIPIILSTKSTLFAEDPWRGVVEALASEGLLVLQVTISVIEDDIAKVIEPGAPPPSKRLEAVAKVSDTVPCVVRYQPFIPCYSDVEERLEKAMEEFARVGFRHVVVESLRIEETRFVEICKLVGGGECCENVELEGYSGDFTVVRPSLRWRLEKYSLAARMASSKGLGFATCKEGVYSVHTVENCCGIHYMNREYTVLRPTLKEVVSLKSKPSTLEDLYRSLPDNYIKLEDLEKMPKDLARGVIAHDRYLVKHWGSAQTF